MNALLRAVSLGVVLLAFGTPVMAQTSSDDPIAVIQRSAEDWNRGDISAFMQSYEDSPSTTFVGTEVARGTEEVLQRYRRTYPDSARMGKTTFSDLEARPLNADLAIVIGRYSLERKPEFGGNRAGIFTLVMRKTPAGWRIIHDHTSTTN